MSKDPSKELYELGLEIRREVVGADKVDKWVADADEFTAPLERLTAEIGWGAIWSRPGLERKTRSLLTLVLLAAHHRDEELEVHLHIAVRNGCSHEEIREALLHTMAYCGIPTARHAVKLASRVLGPQSEG